MRFKAPGRPRVYEDYEMGTSGGHRKEQMHAKKWREIDRTIGTETTVSVWTRATMDRGGCGGNITDDRGSTCLLSWW